MFASAVLFVIFLIISLAADDPGPLAVPFFVFSAGHHFRTALRQNEPVEDASAYEPDVHSFRMAKEKVVEGLV